MPSFNPQNEDRTNACSRIQNFVNNVAKENLRNKDHAKISEIYSIFLSTFATLKWWPYSAALAGDDATPTPT